MTRYLLVPLLALGVACLFPGCGDDHGGGGEEHGHEHGDTHGVGPHGGIIEDIGDHEAHLEVIVDHDKQAVIAHVLTEDNEVLRIKDAPVLNLKLADGSKQLTGKPVDMNADGASEWHFRDEALANEPEGGRFRIQWNGKSYQVDFAHDHDHDHAHDDGDHDDGDHDHDADADHGPHDGVLAAFLDADGEAVGTIELKLHDDKGDLELWITKDGEAYDVSCDSVITVTFNEVEGQDVKTGTAVSLAVRNREKNEDEDGNANMRPGNLTNYFIFPGDTGADASWLQGASFEAHVVVTFTSDGNTYKTEAFDHVPHTHNGDHDHGHDDE